MLKNQTPSQSLRYASKTFYSSKSDGLFGASEVEGCVRSVIMFSYNFKRLMNLIGIRLFRKLLIALQNGNTDAIKEEIAEYISRYFHLWSYNFRVLIIFGFMKKNTRYILR